MSEHDNRGKVSLWKRESDNPKAPVLSGDVVAHRDIREGETLSLSLWRNESQNPKAPKLTGKMEDKREFKAQQMPPLPEPPPFDDDLPF